MLDKGGNQLLPSRWVRMRGISLPVKDAVLRSCQRFGSKAKLDERLHVFCKKIVIEPVYSSPFICNLSILLLHCAEHIMKDRVKADVTKAQFVGDNLQLRLAIGTN